MAVIIENKINWAADQETQIDRYIDTVINEGIPEDKIYVVYLTDDGSKKIWDGSFSLEGKNILGYVDENKPGRFIELNYRDDIMQLLNMTLKQLPPDRENILVSAITQYNDYLEGRFRMRKSEKEYNDAMNKSLIEILNLTGTKQEKFEAIKKLQQEFSSRLEAVKYEIIYPLPQLHAFLLQNSDKVAPFGNFIINWEELCMYSSVPSIPLSVEQNIYLAISIFFESENDFYFRVHTLPWNDSFHEFLKEHKVLFDYLENDTRFTSFNVGYTTEGHFVDLTDLQEQVLKLYSEIGKCLS